MNESSISSDSSSSTISFKNRRTCSDTKSVAGRKGKVVEVNVI